MVHMGYLDPNLISMFLTRESKFFLFLTLQVATTSGGGLDGQGPCLVVLGSHSSGVTWPRGCCHGVLLLGYTSRCLKASLPPPTATSGHLAGAWLTCWWLGAANHGAQPPLPGSQMALGHKDALGCWLRPANRATVTPTRPNRPYPRVGLGPSKQKKKG